MTISTCRNPVRDDDAISYTLAARQVNQIRHILPLNDLIIMTGGGGWKVASGSGSGPITPSSIDASPQSFVGAAPVTPLIIGNRVLYVEAKGSSVREIAFQFVQNQYVSEDRSVLAQHMFAGHKIVSWAYAETPDKVVWAVREDGILLSLTYLAEQQVLAWTQHVTSGSVRSVAVIAEDLDGSGLIDVPYFIVERADFFGGTTQTVERMQTRRLGLNDLDYREAWHVDSGSRYSGPPATGISGFSQFADTQVISYLADGVPGLATVIGGGITLPFPASVVIAGLGFTSSITMLPPDGSHPGDDPWIGRRKHGYRARVAVQNAAGITASIDGGDLQVLVDPDTFQEPIGVVTSVLEVKIAEGWTREGRLTLACSSPLPATIGAVAMEWGVED